jgi:TMEM175 potassium channel family protein
MAERTSDHFEMRRLESLSNTIFGVAMTLLAYDLPRAAQLADPPGWAEIYHLYATRLFALVLSFVIAGAFWFSHHRRLARQPEAGRTVVFLNLIFLLSIILLPATNGLYGTYANSSVVAVLYGFHLTVIAALNASLWLLVPGERRDFGDLAGAFFPLLVFVPGIALASVAPRYAQHFWLLAFGALVVRRLFTHRAVP